MTGITEAILNLKMKCNEKRGEILSITLDESAKDSFVMENIQNGFFGNQTFPGLFLGIEVDYKKDISLLERINKLRDRTIKQLNGFSVTSFEYMRIKENLEDITQIICEIERMKKCQNP